MVPLHFHYHAENGGEISFVSFYFVIFKSLELLVPQYLTGNNCSCSYINQELCGVFFGSCLLSSFAIGLEKVPVHRQAQGRRDVGEEVEIKTLVVLIILM